MKFYIRNYVICSSLWDLRLGGLCNRNLRFLLFCLLVIDAIRCSSRFIIFVLGLARMLGDFLGIFV